MTNPRTLSVQFQTNIKTEPTSNNFAKFLRNMSTVLPSFRRSANRLKGLIKSGNLPNIFSTK